VDCKEGTVGWCMVEGVFGLYYSTTVLLILVQRAHYSINTNNYKKLAFPPQEKLYWLWWEAEVNGFYYPDSNTRH